MTPADSPAGPVCPDVWPLKRGDTLANHDWFPFFGHRFLSSEFVTECIMQGRRDIGFTAVILWAESIRQDPAGTLPTSDVQLAGLARFPDVASWCEVRDQVLHGWVPVLVEDEKQGATIERLGHHGMIEEIVMDMHRRKRGRAAGREANRLAQKKHKIGKKMEEMQVPVHVRNDQNIRAVAIFMADTDLFVTADNVRAAMAEVLGYGAGAIPFRASGGG